MALATRCPYCQTAFRVAADQLKLRGGIVRCGACQRIFDGGANLIDTEAPASARADGGAAPAPGAAAASPVSPAGATPPVPDAATRATPEASAQAGQDAAAPAQPAHGIDFDTVPVYTLDFGGTFGPLGILPRAAPDGAAAAPRPAPDALAAEPAPEPEAEPPAPHGEVLAYALDALTRGAADAAAAPHYAPALPAQDTPTQDTSTPHGDVLAAAVDAAAEAGDAPGGDGAQSQALPDWIEPDGVTPDRVAPDRVAPGQADPAHAGPQQAEPSPLPPASAFAPQGRIEPRFDLPVDEELVAQPLPGHDPEPEAAHGRADGRDAAAPPSADAAGAGDAFSAGLPLRASAAGETPSFPSSTAAPEPKSARARALDARTRRSRMTPTNIDAPKLRVPESDEPEFVKRSRKQERSGRVRRIVMGVGAALLLLALALQLALTFRNTLAARHPSARPALGALCAVFGCRVGLPSQIDSLAIETGELTSLGPDTYALATLLRNGGALPQTWPSIELELTDSGDKPVLRRVFAPAEYLPPGVSAAAGFGARSEQAVKLQFALTDLKPSGYHIAVFYP